MKKPFRPDYETSAEYQRARYAWLMSDPHRAKSLRDKAKRRIKELRKDKRSEFYKHEREQQAEYREEHHDSVRAYNLQYNADHKEHLYKKAREWRQANKQRCRQNFLNWYYVKGGMLKVRRYRRGKVWNSTLLRRSLGPLTIERIDSVIAANIAIYGRLTCILCHQPVEVQDLNIEHKTPVTRGGDHSESNLGVAHSECNLRKGTMTSDEWARMAPTTLVSV